MDDPSRGRVEGAEPHRTQVPHETWVRNYFGNHISLFVKLLLMVDMASSHLKRSRGRPIVAPGPIGDLARALGGMQVLADTLGCHRRSLLKAAREDRWLEGESGIRLLALCSQKQIPTPALPAVPPRELRRRVRSMKGQASNPAANLDHSRVPHPTGARPGRPISIPGPIGQVARALGGIQVLARLLGYSVRALQVAAKRGKWIRDPEGTRLRALCNQNNIPCPLS